MNEGQWGEFQLDSDGYRTFLELYTLPLGILALIFPSVALVATNHRSRQAAANLKAQQEQNVFSNYYAHLAAFEEYARSLIDTDVLSNSPDYFHAINFRTVHTHFYPHARTGDLSFSFQISADFHRRKSSLDKFRTVHEDLIETNEFTSKGELGPVLCDMAPNVVSSAINALQGIERTCGANITNLSFYDHCKYLAELCVVLCDLSEFDDGDYRYAGAQSIWMVRRPLMEIPRLAEERLVSIKETPEVLRTMAVRKINSVSS